MNYTAYRVAVVVGLLPMVTAVAVHAEGLGERLLAFAMCLILGWTAYTVVKDD